jgi:hypothetical protein
MGINVASDTKAGLRFADMIVDGHKTLESRNSDTLRPYVGKRVSIVRTGEGKAKAIGEVTIGEPKVVNQRQFRAMEDEHRVPKGSRFDINTPTKHLYPMHDPVRYEEERDVGHGIVSRQVIHKAGGGSVEPTVDEMRQALAKKGSKDDYFSVLEERDMSNPRYREYLEKQQGLEGSYPETFAAPIARGLSSAAKTAKAIFAPEKKTGQIIQQPIGWGIRVPNKRRFDEPYTYTLPPPAPYVPRAPEEIANQALRRLPERFKDAVMDKAPTNAALSANDLFELARMYKEKEKEKTQNKAKGGSVVKEPKSTVKAYKMFRADPKQPGKLFPLFVDAKTPVPMNKWVDAKEGEMKDGKVKSKIGPLAYRPGWHAGDLPIATHIGDKDDEQKAEIARIKVLRDAMLNDIGNDKEGKKIVNKMYPFPSWVNAPRLRNPRHIWAEVDMPNDVDWHSEATRRGYNDEGNFVANQAHITDQMPKGGHYRYKTNSNMTGNWLIGGSMKVNRILPDEEVRRINEAAGAADLPRIKPMKKEMFGFAHGGSVGGDETIAPDEFKAEEYVNYKAEGGKVEPTVDQMRQALINRHGLYSPLEKAALEMPRNKGTGAEFMAELSKRPGYKAEEIADRKIPTPEGKMTKAEFLEHLKKHSLPPLEEKIKGESTPKDEDQVWNRVSQEMFGVNADDLTERQFSQVENLIPSEIRRTNTAAQYEKYQLPGGKNYREVLLKLPRGRPDASKYSDPAKYDADMRAFNAKGQEDFQSSHWGNDPNVLAHMRMSDRTGANGEKLLHLEEVQSDWHQAGRDKGYRDTANEMQRHNEFETYSKELAKKYGLNPNQNLAMYATMKGIDPTEVAKYEQLQNAMIEVSDKVPDAPFKKTWHEMALKHALHHAAKNGYDGMVITPGDEQADRYKLSRHIDSVMLVPNPYPNQTSHPYYFKAFDKQGNRVADDAVNEDKLKEYIGKEPANQLLSTPPNPMGERMISGANIVTGGEGMKGFYDKMIPTYLNKLGKPHGVQVGQMPIETESANRLQVGEMTYEDPAKTKTVHHFPINDQMRTSILKEGLPQYMRGGIVHKAEGGAVLPIEQIKAQMMNRFKGINQLQSIGAEEAPSMGIKAFVSPVGRPDNNQMPVGGVDTSQGNLPVGGIDMSQMQSGQQMMPNNMLTPSPAGQQPGMDQTPMGDMPPPMGGMPPPRGGSNILQMTPQGQAMAAMKPQGLAKGGSAKSIDEMKSELASNKDTSTEKRITVPATGAGGVKGIVVPKHLIEGNPKAGAEGLKNMMTARAKVYGEEHREPLNLGQMGRIHKQTLEEHFAKPLDEQKKAENEALNKIRAAKFIKHNKDTLDESEKLDTVEHEYDEQGRSYVGYASKGIAGHALFPKGHGKDMDYKVINTCPGQTEGCGGGKSAEGIVDTKQGTCFAPNAESQYAAAVSRRAGHAIAKHDPAMTRDWIIAHTGSMRNAAGRADKQNKRMLYRPNVVDETDVSSRHVIRHLNEQRKMDDKPQITANSYGKTNERHDPENGYHKTHSNVGPKVKKGQEISENVARDKARVRNTVMAADNQGDFKNEQGNKTPPEGSYMVTDVKRGSPMAKNMEKAITHAKYWSTGRTEKDLTPEEREEGPEGHYSGTGRKTSEDKAHYGHTTHEGLRYDYQKQHILHPRLVQVGKNDDGTAHMIPTDSRFKDTEFLPKNRYKTKNGKDAGHILMTTPTESTSNIGHQTSFTHNVSPEHIEHALKNNGEYVIDKPEDQAKAKGKEYAAPQAIKFQPKPKAYALGGSVGGRHIGFSDDDFHAFPEQNVVAQRHLAMRGHDHEPTSKSALSDTKRKVTMNKDMDTMLLELTRNKKAK